MNEEKHKDMIEVLSQSLPKPPPEDELALPPSLSTRLQATQVEHAKTSLLDTILGWLRSTPFTYAASAAVVVFGVFLAIRSTQAPDSESYGLRGTSSTTSETAKIIIFRPSGEAWEEFKELTDPASYTLVKEPEVLEKVLAEEGSSCIVINYEKSHILRYSLESAVPEEVSELPTTGIDLLALIEEWQR